jgi:hypothetical protein
MKTMKWKWILVSFVLFQHGAFAQYWGERVLEKGFERSDFFFAPSYLNPYGIGSFKSTTPGFLKDPLVDLVINPARLRLDSLQTTYFYTDFRSARDITDRTPAYYPPWINYATRMTSDMVYFPRVYLNTRRELEPVFSGAFIARPLPVTAAGLTVGFTYQLVMQDEKYYSVPQDIYKSAVGYDYNGMRAAAADNIPVVDKYSGEDNMHHAGHFASGFVRYAFPEGLDIGAKLSRVTFSRDGSFGSSNLWQHYQSGSSLWSNLEAREQTYGHWDVAGGIEYRLTEQTSLGGSVGYIWGDADQTLRNNDSSYYSYSSTSWSSFYNRSSNTLHDWKHDGRTTYFGFDVATRVSPASTLNFIYQRQQSTVDITLGSTIRDTSYSTYAWSNAGGETENSYSQSYLSDLRSGKGSSEATNDRLLATLQWDLEEWLHLSIGAQVEWQKTETNTTEGVSLVGHSAYWSTTGSWDYRYGNEESKDLHWNFTTSRTSFQIPIFVTFKLSRVVDILLGLNRNMTQWEIEDVTLAIFRYRMSMSNGTVNREENFGERYTQPKEKVSDVRTTFLAGLTVAPSKSLELRLLMVPNFRDGFEGTELEQLQWWIGLTVTP